MSRDLSPIHPRVEYKYIISPERAATISDLLDAIMIKDPHQDKSHHEGYPVTSVYYDTLNYDFYHEKIEGEYFHRKARLRTYGLEPFKGPSFFELKYKYHDDGYKHRTPIDRPIPLLDLGQMMQLGSCETREILGGSEILPICTVFYRRKAYSVPGMIRVNLDSSVACCFEELPYRPDSLDSKHPKTGTHTPQDRKENLFLHGEVVLEIKAPHRGHLDHLSEIMKIASERRMTFSKYTSCMNLIYSEYLMETPHGFS